METAKNLNFGSDEMQMVITALHDVGRRIKEVGETHKPLFGGEHFLTGKEVCERLYISPRTLQDYRDETSAKLIVQDLLISLYFCTSYLCIRL